MGAFFGPAGSTGGSGGGGSTGANTKIVFSNGEMHVQILGQPGQKFDLWVSDNLSTNWINIATVSLTGNVYDFVDKPSTGKGLRFYRAIAIP
jgi:hypothetical protein